MDWADFLHTDCDAIIVGKTTCKTPGGSWKDPMKKDLSILASWHLSGCFLEIGSLDFSGFCQGASNYYEVVHNNPIFLKNFFCPKNWGNGLKISFLNLKKNLVIKFHWIVLINMLIICCVPVQILCLGKILFLRCRPKYAQLIKLHNF